MENILTVPAAKTTMMPLPFVRRCHPAAAPMHARQQH
jgi:hypothetical protein